MYFVFFGMQSAPGMHAPGTTAIRVMRLNRNKAGYCEKNNFLLASRNDLG
jgi:hypothetical protein